MPKLYVLSSFSNIIISIIHFIVYPALQLEKKRKTERSEVFVRGSELGVVGKHYLLRGWPPDARTKDR